MIRSRVRRKKISGFSWPDRLLARTDWTGKMGTRFAGTVNAAIRNPPSEARRTSGGWNR
jgi:hypothetical protein